LLIQVLTWLLFGMAIGGRQPKATAQQPIFGFLSQPILKFIVNLVSREMVFL